MHQYAGQLMTTGAQAEVYADHFIANHLKVMGGGLTYSQLSAKAIAQPNNVKLAAQVQLMFRGTTLRSMLLNAYAFGTMATIAGIAAIAAFIAAAFMLILGGLGLAHSRRVSPAADILSGHPARTPPAPAPHRRRPPGPASRARREGPRRRHTRQLQRPCPPDHSLWPTRP